MVSNGLLVGGLKEYMYTGSLEPDQIAHIQSMVAKRGLTNWVNVHTPCVEKVV